MYVQCKTFNEPRVPLMVLIASATQIHARLGEVLFMSATNSSESNIVKVLAQSTRRFCRSIELCDGYLRGYYGLKMVGSVNLVIFAQDFT